MASQSPLILFTLSKSEGEAERVTLSVYSKGGT